VGPGGQESKHIRKALIRADGSRRRLIGGCHDDCDCGGGDGEELRDNTTVDRAVSR
jgi:hypothetical protein